MWGRLESWRDGLSPFSRLLMVTTVLYFHIFAFMVLVPVEPQYVERLYGGADAMESASYFLGWVQAGRALMELVCNPVMGSMSDIVGRRPMLMLALFGSLVEPVMKGLIPSLASIAAVQIAVGSLAGTELLCLAYIADTDTDGVVSNFGLQGVALGAGFVTGPIIGGLLGADRVQLVYFLSFAAELLALLLVIFLLPESVPRTGRPSFSCTRLNPFAVIKVALTPAVRFTLSCALFLSFLPRNVSTIWSLYTEYRFQWESPDLGFFLAISGVVTIATMGLLLRILLTTFAARDIAVGALIMGALALGGFGFAPHGWFMYACLPLAALSFLSDPTMRGVLAQQVTVYEQGEMMGAVGALQTLSRVIGPLVATNLFAFFISDNAPFPLPGAPFFFYALVQLLALLLAVVALYRPEYDQWVKRGKAGAADAMSDAESGDAAEKQRLVGADPAGEDTASAGSPGSQAGAEHLKRN